MYNRFKYYKIFIFLLIGAINSAILLMLFLIHCSNQYSTIIQIDSNNNTYLICDSRHLYVFTKHDRLKIILTNENIGIFTNVGSYHKDKNNRYYVIIYISHKYLLTNTTMPVKVIYDSKSLFKVLF